MEENIILSVANFPILYDTSQSDYQDKKASITNLLAAGWGFLLSFLHMKSYLNMYFVRFSILALENLFNLNIPQWI